MARKRVKPVTQRQGWLLSVLNPAFKPDSTPSPQNKKWLHQSGSFQSIYDAQQHAEHVYGKGVKTNITGARVNMKPVEVPEQNFSARTVQKLVKVVTEQKKSA